MRIASVRCAIPLSLLSLLLSLPACDPGSSDDAAQPDTETDTATTGTPASDDSAGPDPDTSTTGSTTAPEPTSADSSDGGDATTTSGTTTQGDDSSGEDQPLPPTNGAELLPWLEAGEYLGWTAESGVHPSTGPHFGGVRTFVNDVLYASLEAGAATHPEGSAAIKELYGDGGAVLGWSVEVKLQAESAGGDGWYWYERYQDSVYADGTGEGICTGCHGGGNDYVLSPFPLQ